MDISWMLEFTQKITSAYNRCCEPLCQEFEISRTSADILLFLANNPRFYTAKEISRYRCLKPNVVSIHVDQLVNDGYLRREAIPEDRRKVKLICTQMAEPIIRKGQRMQKKFHDDLMAGIDPQDVEAFRHCFQVIMENTEHLSQGKKA